MVRALFVCLIAWLFFSGAFAHAAAEQNCARRFARLRPDQAKAAREALEQRRQTFLANPPTGPYRVLKADEVSVTPMNDGKLFFHTYIDDRGIGYYEGQKRTIGNVITFTGPRGRPHTIQIFGPSVRPDLLKQVTDLVLSLPADVLDATKQIEIQHHIKISDTSTLGYALDSAFVLHNAGISERTVRHEFGHNLMHHLFGSRNPPTEWTRLVELDGGRFVSEYAAKTFSYSGYSEDAADAFFLYLGDAKKFRQSFPNRAAFFDTVVRDSTSPLDSPFATGGLWRPLQDDRLSRISLFRRLRTDYPNPVVAIGAGVVSIAGAAGGIYYLKIKYQETDRATFSQPVTKPRPMQPENSH